jgi:hypothetical protein
LGQVVIPVLKGTRLFPLFDRERRAADDDLVRVRDQQEIDELRREADAESHRR